MPESAGAVGWCVGVVWTLSQQDHSIPRLDRKVNSLPGVGIVVGEFVGLSSFTVPGVRSVRLSCHPRALDRLPASIPSMNRIPVGYSHTVWLNRKADSRFSSRREDAIEPTERVGVPVFVRANRI